MTIITDSVSPLGGSGVLGVTFAKDRRIDIKQNLKTGPGKYKLTAYMDTTRCTKPGGYAMIYLSGSINGKWHNFGTFATPGTAKGGWKKTEWTKYEKIITVPEGGMIKSINITLISITGTVMLDGISLCDYSDDDAQKEQEQARAEAVARYNYMYRAASKVGNLKEMRAIQDCICKVQGLWKDGISVGENAQVITLWGGLGAAPTNK